MFDVVFVRLVSSSYLFRTLSIVSKGRRTSCSSCSLADLRSKWNHLRWWFWDLEVIEGNLESFGVETSWKSARETRGWNETDRRRKFFTWKIKGTSCSTVTRHLFFWMNEKRRETFSANDVCGGEQRTADVGWDVETLVEEAVFEEFVRDVGIGFDSLEKRPYGFRLDRRSKSSDLRNIQSKWILSVEIETSLSRIITNRTDMTKNLFGFFAKVFRLNDKAAVTDGEFSGIRSKKGFLLP